MASLRPLDAKTTHLVVESRTAQVDRYRSRGDSNPQNAISDLALVEKEWKNRMQKSIEADAERTNSWSLLWKAEAVYEAMDEQVSQTLLKMLRDGQSSDHFHTMVISVCSRGKPDGQQEGVWTPLQVMQAKYCKEFQDEMMQIYRHSAVQPRPLRIVDVQRRKMRYQPPILSWSSGTTSTKSSLVDLSTSDDTKGPLPPSDAGGAASAERVGGQVTQQDFDGLVEYWVLRQKAAELSDRMFEQLSSWTKCDGRLRIPDRRPPVEGFNHLASRVVEWVIWPYLSPGVFPTHRNILLYGPAGAGKTVISQLVAYDMARALQWSRSKLESQRDVSPDLNDYTLAYFIDALKLRAGDPELVGARLRNYLNCLQYEVTRDQHRDKRRKLALLVLDNIDTLFVSDEELRRQPRAERKSSQIKSWIYKASPEVIAKFGGQPPPPPPPPPPFKSEATSPTTTTTTTTPLTTESKVGGQSITIIAATPTGTATTTTSSNLSGRSMADVIGSILSPAALEAEYPDLRVIWDARYVWRLPPLLQGYVRQRQLFVDLPTSAARRSILESLVRDDLYSNIADRILEEQKLQELKQLDNKTNREYLKHYLNPQADRKTSEPDSALYNAELNLKFAVEHKFWSDYNEWARLPIKPTPGNLLSSIVHSNSAYKQLADKYIKELSGVLDFITTASGMSLEGFCKLQTEFGLNFAEVDMFLITTGKKRDGFAGTTPFGFTLEDLQNYFKILKASINQRLLHQAFETKQAFIYGSSRFASNGCKQTALDVQMELSKTGISPLDINRAINWSSKNGEDSTCKFALGADLTDVRSGLPVIPLWARFGSHRILKVEDAMKALASFERYITPKADYPEFVNYVLHKVPRLNRPLLPPSQISQMCLARPGPASTFLFPPTGVLSQTAVNRNLGQLTPWSVLFAPTPKIGGANPIPTDNLSFAGQYRNSVQAVHSGDRRYGGVAKRRVVRRKLHTPRRRHSSHRKILDDANHLPIDALFQYQ
jgi:hypothetical protein